MNPTASHDVIVSRVLRHPNFVVGREVSSKHENPHEHSEIVRQVFLGELMGKGKRFEVNLTVLERPVREWRDRRKVLLLPVIVLGRCPVAQPVTANPMVTPVA
jgi:hypothetical protein